MSQQNDGPIEISGGFVLLTLWFAVENGWRPLALFLSAAALHEAGHLLALFICGAPVRRLKIGALGAVMDVESRQLSYGRESLAVLAGPLTNLLCAGLLLAPAQRFETLYAFVGANLVLGAFNLLPIRPLDGGRMLELLVCWRFGPSAGDAAARLSGTACAFSAGGALVWIIHTSGGNLWLAPAAAALLAVGVKEALGR